MSVLCRPVVAVPENVITQEETLNLARRLHSNNSHLSLVLRLIGNTGVRKRHLVQPLEVALRNPGFEERIRVHNEEAKRRVPPVIEAALAEAGLGTGDIDLIIYVSCTGFAMPSMTAWLINEMGPAAR